MKAFDFGTNGDVVNKIRISTQTSDHGRLLSQVILSTGLTEDSGADESSSYSNGVSTVCKYDLSSLFGETQEPRARAGQIINTQDSHFSTSRSITVADHNECDGESKDKEQDHILKWSHPWLQGPDSARLLIDTEKREAIYNNKMKLHHDRGYISNCWMSNWEALKRPISGKLA